MSKKDNCLLFIFSAIVMISLMLALTPTSDFDQDGVFDSLISDGFLLLPLILSFTRHVRRDPFPAARFANPQVFSRTFNHPPIPA